MNKDGILRILVVDDDADDFIIISDYIKRALPGKAELEWCGKYDDALEEMTHCKYDLYFVDYLMGAKSGIDLLKEAIASNCEEPIVMLTGKGSTDIDNEAIRSGAADYLVKSELTVEKIERCVRYAMNRASVLRALKAGERKYRTIFEKSKDILFVADAEMHVIDVNDAVTTTLGYSKAQFLDMRIYDVIVDEVQQRLLQRFLATGKEIKDIELVLKTQSEETKTCLLTITAEMNENNQQRIQGIIHDITNLKKNERANLQVQKLGLAGRLVHTLAHEVRNPLNNITLSVEQLREDIADEDVLSYLDIISRNSTRINTLISELLNTSRPAEIAFQSCVFQSVIDDVVAAAIDRATLKHMQFEVNYPDAAIHIKVDKEKLVIAVLNIVINAIEAMEEGEGKLVIDVNVQGEHVLVSITDNGCGISEVNISKLFEPYFTQKRNGVGLGLALTLNIIQSHNGTIEVTSGIGKGTQFLITLPLENTGVYIA